MNYGIESLSGFDKKLKKLAKKDRLQYERIRDKVEEITREPHRYKPLGNVMAGKRRIHFGSFVLVFSIDEEKRLVILEDFEHHDKAYGR